MTGNNNLFARAFSMVFALCFLSPVSAESLYVIDSIKIGLHQDRTVDSPITKLVPSGMELTVVERSGDMVLVKETSGLQGWINAKYLVSEKPGRAQVLELQKQNEKLQNEIETLKSQNVVSANNTDNGNDGSQKRLEQQLNAERLKAGELQAELADLRAKIANIDDPDNLLSEMNALKQENEQLIEQVHSSGMTLPDNLSSAGGNGSINSMSTKHMVISVLFLLLIGMVVGAYLLDFYNRRRHGGFRV